MQDVPTAVTGREIRPEPGCACDFRQLRHHTKNALQQILLQIADAQSLGSAVCSNWLLADLQRRIRLTSEISDALFGLTRSPAALSERLRSLSETVIRMLADDVQMISLEVSVAGDCPERLQQLVLRIAHEFIGNAVKHGMRARLTGAITVHVTAHMDGRVALLVTDDGWGCDGSQEAGGGLRIATDLAAAAGGTVSLRRAQVTMARLELPAPGGFGNKAMRPRYALTTEQEQG